MNLPEYYIENKFHKKDETVFELIYQNPQYSLCIKHPIQFTDEENTPVQTRIVETDYFRTYYPIISESFNTINFKQKKLVIDHAIKSLEALSQD